MKRLASLLPMLVAGAVAADPAADAQALRLRALAANCAACHGTEGRSTADALIPGLAGMPPEYFVLQMKAFQSGARQGTVMPQLARGFSEAQVRALAEYFAAARKGPK